MDILLKVYRQNSFNTLSTSVTKHSASLSDVFLTNKSSGHVKAGVFANDLSDHLPILIRCKLNIDNRVQQLTAMTQKIAEQKFFVIMSPLRIGRVCMNVLMEMVLIRSSSPFCRTYMNLHFLFNSSTRKKYVRKP